MGLDRPFYIYIYTYYGNQLDERKKTARNDGLRLYDQFAGKPPPKSGNKNGTNGTKDGNTGKSSAATVDYRLYRAVSVGALALLYIL